MTSPRFSGSGLLEQRNTLARLVAFAVLLQAAPCLAQSTRAVPGRDSAAAGAPDSARTDSARTDSGSTESARTDSAAVAPGDSGPPRGTQTAAPPARPAPAPPAPVDSALGAACEGNAGGLPDVLLVKFRPTSTESERSAVATEVGGTVLGMSELTAPGSWYLKVPGSGTDPSVADRLILLPPVLEVEATRCPS